MSELVREAPEHLGAEGRAFWESVHAAAAVREVDVPMLRLACESLDRVAEARSALSEHGLTMTGSRGQTVQRPELYIQREAFQQYLNACKSLGIHVDKEVRRG